MHIPLAKRSRNGDDPLMNSFLFHYGTQGNIKQKVCFRTLLWWRDKLHLTPVVLSMHPAAHFPRKCSLWSILNTSRKKHFLAWGWMRSRKYEVHYMRLKYECPKTRRQLSMNVVMLVSFSPLLICLKGQPQYSDGSFASGSGTSCEEERGNTGRRSSGGG